MSNQILKANELAIDKWGNAPKFSKGPSMELQDNIRLTFETKEILSNSKNK